MERAEYERLAALDRRLWWFHGMHAQMLGALGRRRPPRKGERILDAGCGTGGLLAGLGERFPEAQPVGVEIDAVAGAVARDHSGRPVCIGSVNALPFADARFTAVLSSDVLCHEGVDEEAALQHFLRCLAPGGVLVLNLPAYAWLLSWHDSAVHNVRRYSAARVRRLLAAAGFTAIRTSYWNTLLFPLMVLRRKLGWRKGAPRASDVAMLPAPVEAAFRLVVRIEAGLVGLGLRLPFGGSVLATAVKP
ncbi:MAG TPA: methyltransferase domain-containing protein [Stellaceae bacterium]|nr:methyltransferase domain-containing protein [Stellaceae bacterium]